MTNNQDANSKVGTEPRESLKEAGQNKVSQVFSTSEKDALGDSSLADVSGGSWPYNNLARASYASTGGAG